MVSFLSRLASLCIDGTSGSVDEAGHKEHISTDDYALRKAVKDVEDKFATYWPRNTIILFGPVSSFRLQPLFRACRRF